MTEGPRLGSRSGRRRAAATLILATTICLLFGSTTLTAQAPDAAVPTSRAEAPPNTAGDSTVTETTGLVMLLTVFALAVFVGFEIITKVPPTLHTPLMSGSNAISGITIVGALIVAGQGRGFSGVLGLLAVAAATINVVGGFMVTNRMLSMFRRKD